MDERKRINSLSKMKQVRNSNMYAQMDNETFLQKLKENYIFNNRLYAPKSGDVKDMTFTKAYLKRQRDILEKFQIPINEKNMQIFEKLDLYMSDGYKPTSSFKSMPIFGVKNFGANKVPDMDIYYCLKLQKGKETLDLIVDEKGMFREGSVKKLLKQDTYMRNKYHIEDYKKAANEIISQYANGKVTKNLYHELFNCGTKRMESAMTSLVSADTKAFLKAQFGDKTESEMKFCRDMLICSMKEEVQMQLSNINNYREFSEQFASNDFKSLLSLMDNHNRMQKDVLKLIAKQGSALDMINYLKDQQGRTVPYKIAELVHNEMNKSNKFKNIDRIKILPICSVINKTNKINDAQKENLQKLFVKNLIKGKSYNIKEVEGLINNFEYPENIKKLKAYFATPKNIEKIKSQQIENVDLDTLISKKSNEYKKDFKRNNNKNNSINKSSDEIGA